MRERERGREGGREEIDRDREKTEREKRERERKDSRDF